MASVLDHTVHKPFPTLIGEYRTQFTAEEEAELKKITDPEYYRRNSLVADGGHGGYFKADPYSTPEERYNDPVWDDDFLVLYVGMNLLKQPKLQSIGDTILEVARHYIIEVAGMLMPNEVILDFADSWIIRTTSTNAYPSPSHRCHNHSFAWLTGVIYLEDNPNGTVLHNRNSFGDQFMPFCWQLKEDPNNDDNADDISIPAEKGKIILFPSDIKHSIMNNADNSTRHTIAFNIFPFGDVNKTNAAMLRYTQK